MLRIRITPLDWGHSTTRDAYTFRIQYFSGGQELSTEQIMTTGEPDAAFDAMFEVAKRQIRAMLPPLRVAGPSLFMAALAKATMEIDRIHTQQLPPLIPKEQHGQGEDPA